MTDVSTLSVYVVRDSHCGNGADDPGEVLSVWDSFAKADHERRRLECLAYAPLAEWRDYSVEGPFSVNPPTPKS